ncbi:MAG: NAD-binding protein [Phycisphaerae bacterium]
MNRFGHEASRATYRDHQVLLGDPVDWPDGTKLMVVPVLTEADAAVSLDGHVLIAGFGLAGRYVADLLESVNIEYVVIERNPVTVETQRALGRRIVQGDVTESETLAAASLHEAAILALTIPDDEAVLAATTLARRLRPDIYIIARTNYSSKGMRASQLGADDVVKAEHAVALHFYECLSRRIRSRTAR